MNGFNKPMLQGGPPQQGGMGGPTPQGGQPGPMQGPPQMGPGMGGGPPQQGGGPPQQGGQAPPSFGGNYGLPTMMNTPQGPPPGMQQEIQDIQWQLIQAQNAGAKPNVIAYLQMQLMQAQRAFQEAGMRALYERQVGEPMRGGSRGSVGSSNTRHGGGGGGFGMSPSDQAASRNYGLGTDLLAQLWGLGGGGYGQIG